MSLITVSIKSGTTAEACENGLFIAELFDELYPDLPERRGAALLALFPDVAAVNGTAFIDKGHMAMRMEFVRRGLMLGEFHPLSEVASIHNPRFHVMRSPVPMFIVRALSPHDIRFLDRPETSPERRAWFLRYYLRHLEEQIDAEAREQILNSIKSADRTVLHNAR